MAIKSMLQCSDACNSTKELHVQNSTHTCTCTCTRYRVIARFLVMGELISFCHCYIYYIYYFDVVNGMLQ